MMGHTGTGPHGSSNDEHRYAEQMEAAGDTYDSRVDTQLHIERVTRLCGIIAEAICARAFQHDQSKLHSPEKEIFDEVTPLLKSLTYGSEEYKHGLQKLGPALQHHYEHNRHHPEHHVNGVSDMTLVDLVEMFCDWKAASERHADGSFERSIELNRTRFAMSDQLAQIFHNTRAAMGWGEPTSTAAEPQEGE